MFTLRTTIRAGKPIWALLPWKGYLYGANSEDYSFSAKIFRSADGGSWQTLGTFNTYSFFGFAAEPDTLYLSSVENPGGASFAIRSTTNGTTWNTIFYTTSEGKTTAGRPEFFSQTRTAFFSTDWIYPSRITRIVPVQNSVAGSRILPQHGFTSFIEVNGRLFGIGAQRADAWDSSPHVISLLGNYRSTNMPPPVANPQTVLTYADQPVSIMLTGSDRGGAPLTFSVVTNPLHGILVPINGATRAYTPDTDYVGSDNFVFTASNGQDISAPVMVTITVRPRPVILIPGIGGSYVCNPPSLSCSLTGIGWPADVLKGSSGNPENLQFTEAGTPRTDNASSNLLATALFGRINDLATYLSGHGYGAEQTLFDWPYDFRKSVPTLAVLLAQRIEQIRTATGAENVDIVAHSMGGLIAKQHMQNTGPNAHVKTFIMIGTPHLGTPMALKALRYGDNDFGFLEELLTDECKIKRAGHNWPSIYNLLPGRDYFRALGQGYFGLQQPDTTTAVLDFTQTLITLGVLEEHHCALLPSDPPPTTTLSASHLQTHMADFHDQLDHWTQPTGTKVYTIAGYGRSTVFQIAEPRLDSTRTLPLLFSNFRGDGTVVFESATNVTAAVIYYANVAALGVTHAGMPGSLGIQQQVLQLLHHDTNTVAKNVSTDIPEIITARTMAFIALSPVRLSVYNSQGQHTGFLDDGTKEERIPLSAANAIDHFQYVTVPAGDSYQVVLRGTDNGTFSLLRVDVDEAGQPLRTFGWMNNPVQVGSVAKLVTYFDDERPLLFNTDADGHPLGGFNPSSRAYGTLRFHDLALQATAGRELAFVGQEVPFTFTVTNSGVNPALDVRLSVVLPPAVALSAVNSTSCVVTDYGVDCSLGNLDSHAAASTTLTIRLLQSGFPPVRAWIAGNGIDINPTNNQVMAAVEAFSDPCDAVAILMLWVSRSIPRRQTRPLIATLKAACASFNQGHTRAGIQQLEAFENKIQAQLGRDNPALADDLAEFAEKIVQALR